MNAPQMIQAQNVEISMLRKQVAQLQQERLNRMLFEKLVCSALTGAVSKSSTPKEAAQIAVESAQAVIAQFQPEQNEDHEMNQRP